MKRLLYLLVIYVLVFATAETALAITAKPGPRILSQPDGSTFIGRLIGDEHFHFAETMDGYSIIRNDVGWWTYARQNNGLLVPGTIIVGRGSCPYDPHLRPNAAAIAKLPENAGKMINVSAEIRDQWAKQTLYGPGGTKEYPSKAATGRQYVNVLLGDFTDSTFAKYANDQRLGRNPYGPFPFGSSTADDQAANIRWFNFLAIGDSSSPFAPDSSAVGSMSNFYFDFTYRKMWWYGSVAYGKTTRTRAQANSGTTTYFQSAVTTCDASVNYYQGGSVNNLIVVHPGPGEEESDDAADIWSASYTGLSLTNGDGAAITKCIAVPQNAQLGVFCHEMFHQVGGPDLYDYGYSSTPVGEWSLMDNGSWNGIVNGGDAPAFPGAFLTYDINGALGSIDGWLTQSDSIGPSNGKQGDGKYTIMALDSAGEARRGNTTSGVRLWRIKNNTFRNQSQIFFVENRRRTPPYEIGLSEEGLIITHIDTRMDCNDGSPATRAFYAWVESPGFDPNPLYAAGDTILERTPSNAAYSADDYSPGGFLENRIDSTSIPNSWIDQIQTTTPDSTGPWIYDISREGPVMTFNVLRSGKANTAPLVSYLTATVLDPAAGGGANNNNGLLDPWETDSIKLTFKNDSVAITASQCSLYVLNGYQYVSVTPGWKNIGAMAIGAQATSLPFVVSVSQNTPRFTDILFGVKLTGSPSFTDTSNFTLRISPFDIVQTYDFSNIAVGGSGYSYRLQPCDLAVWHDTLYVANANLNFATFYSRIHKVRRNASTPLVPADTARSINNMGAANSTTRYLGGIDADEAGNLWYSIADSCWEIDRIAPSPTIIKQFRMPNVSWAGTPMKRIRGVCLGPGVVDTVGSPDPLPGDSLWGYWQNYFDTSAAGSGAESLYVIQRSNSGTSTIRYRYGFADSSWGAWSYPGNGYSWWNGRALEYDGSNLWTSSVSQNLLIRRNARDARITMVMPGPSEFGVYGTYGIAHEATDAAGAPYAPSGTIAYQPYRRGTQHFLYCASMDEGKIYKIRATDFFVPTPCDSVVARYVDATHDRLVWFKHNADTQKVQGYLIMGRTDPNPPNPATDSMTYVNSSRSGTQVSNKDSVTITHAKSAKAAYYYTVVPVSYGGSAGYGAAVMASPLAIELTDFSCTQVNGTTVTLRWVTASEADLSGWVVERSSDGTNYSPIGTIAVNGPDPMGKRYSYTDQLADPGMYYYRIADVSLSGFKTYHGPLVVTFGAPTVYSLGQNFPNPVGTSATAIKYALKSPGHTSLRIYNVLGEAVRTLVNQRQGANYYTVRWDGTDDNGRQVANGIFFYKLISGDFTATKKMMVLK